MNIGVVAVGYQCKDLASILLPWFYLKTSSKFNFKICAVSALFKERWDQGEVYKEYPENTTSLLNAVDKKILDKYIQIDQPILDYQSRVAAWDYLKQFDLDYIWELDLYDEHYTTDEIENSLKWIEENSLYDFYRINFKNYFGRPEDQTYVLDFKPVRIINNKVHGGIKNFYWDNDVEFNDGTKTPNCAGAIIPRRICNPKHLSWVGDKSFLIKKIQYQLKAINTCSYKWCLEKDKLILNDEYYNKVRLPKPEIYEDK